MKHGVPGLITELAVGRGAKGAKGAAPDANSKGAVEVIRGGREKDGGGGGVFFFFFFVGQAYITRTLLGCQEFWPCSNKANLSMLRVKGRILLALKRILFT